MSTALVMRTSITLTSLPAGAASWWCAIYGRLPGESSYTVYEPLDDSWPVMVNHTTVFELPEEISDLHTRIIIYRSDDIIIENREFAVPVRGKYMYDWVGNRLEKAYYVALAEGDSFDELKQNAEGKYVYGNHAITLRTRDLPGWMLSSTSWLIDKAKGPLNAIGVKLTGTQVNGGDITIFMYKNPIPILILVILGALLVFGTLAYKFIFSQEIQETLAVKLKIAQADAERAASDEEKAEVLAKAAEDILDAGLPPEVAKDMIDALTTASTTTPTITPNTPVGIDWEKYLTWGMIGGGVIIGTAVLLPIILRKRIA